METNEKIVNIKKAPSWMVDNRFLLEGYRVGFNSFKSNLKSLFKKHNELMNVWTHLIGALIFIGILIFIAQWQPIQRNLFEDINKSMRLFLSHSNHWTSVYNNEIESHLKQITSEDLKKLMTTSNIRYLQLQKNKINLLFEQEIDQLNSNLKLVISKEEILEIEKLKKELKSVILFTSKYLTFLFNNINKIQNSDSIYKNKNLTMYIRNAAENLIEKFRNLKLLDTKIKKIFRKNGNRLKTYPIAIFLITAIFCLGSSAVFHLFNPISLPIFTILHKIDLAGVSVLNLSLIHI